MKIAISVGHTLNGADIGASKYLNESKETREVADRVVKLLESKGHTVVLCRIDSASTVNESLAYRVNKANAANVDLFIEIHFNAGGGTGCEAYTISTSGKAYGYSKNICSAINELGFANRGAKIANFYVIKYTNAPAVLVECCFVDSQADANRYNADKMAQKIVKGIIGEDVVIDDTKINYDYISLEGCNIVDSNNNITGALWEGERCQLMWITSDYRKYVRYLNSTGTAIKEGLVEEGKTKYVVALDDAYTHYNAADYTINVIDNAGYKGEITGAVWANEKVCVLHVNDLGNAYIAYDNSAGEKLCKKGYIPSVTLRKIGEVIPTPTPDPDPTPDPEKKYKYTVEVLTTTDEKEANSTRDRLLELGYFNTKITKKEITE